jgi:hypothetical protein
MNKFGNPTDEDFLTLRDVVEEMIARSPKLISDRSSCNNPSS